MGSERDRAPRTRSGSGVEGLTPSEELRLAAVTGAAVRRGDDEPAVEGATWGPDRQLPGALIYELLTAEQAPVRAVVLIGLRITGALNAEAVVLRAPLIAHRCWFDEPVNLIRATAEHIELTACEMPELDCNTIVLRGDLELSGSTLRVLGMLGARVGGDVRLRGTVLLGGSYPITSEQAGSRSPNARAHGAAASRSSPHMPGSTAGWPATRDSRRTEPCI